VILDKQIKIVINNRHVKYYKDKGYNIKGGDTIIINIEDLPDSSHYMVNVKCDICNKEHKIKYYNYFINLNKNNKYYCFNCKGHLIKKTNLKKYGVESTLQLNSVKEKSKKTMIDKYGIDHYSKSDKFKNNVIDKYGVKSTLQLNSVKEKSKKTIIDKYGVDHYSKSKDFSDKIKKANIKKHGVDHYSKTISFKEKIRIRTLEKLIDRHDIDIIDYKNSEIIVKCEKDHNFSIHRDTLKNRIRYKTELCTICNKISSQSTSGYELQLLDFINSNYDDEIITNSRSIINKELDIYLPKLKLAFEFNGLYWHNELNKDKNYHLNKTEKCEQIGIQLVHIYEDDWLYKQEIVKSMIINKLNKSEKIYARKTQIKEIYDNGLVKDFLDKNHIQGYIGSKIKIGLFYDDILVSLITFGKRRISMGIKLNIYGEYELLRFCNKLNINVIGGASKLFKYFINNYIIKEITTYADRSYSEGKLYNILGFEYIGKTQPNYHYIVDGVRSNRFNFRKDVLIKEGYDKNKTEHEIMTDRNIYRIYNSGNLKFIYTKK
jgi:hypothetical protein